MRSTCASFRYTTTYQWLNSVTSITIGAVGARGTRAQDMAQIVAKGPVAFSTAQAPEGALSNNVGNAAEPAAARMRQAAVTAQSTLVEDTARIGTRVGLSTKYPSHGLICLQFVS
jgi:hypothetical protein